MKDPVKMKDLVKLTIIAAVVTSLLLLGFIIQLGGFLQLPLMLMVVLYPMLVLADLFSIAWTWKQERWKSFIPFGISLAGIALLVASFYGGHKIKDGLFWRNLPKYQQVVELIENEEIAVTDLSRKLDLPPSLTPRCLSVRASRESNGTLIVEFLTGVGFPVKHTGYMYHSKDEVEEGSKIARRWPLRTEMTDHWYRVSD